MTKYEPAFQIGDYEGTRFAFEAVLRKLLGVIPPDKYIKVKMTVEIENG